MIGNPRRQDPSRSHRREVGHLQGRHEVGEPQQQAQVQGHRRRHRPRRCVGCRHAGRAGLPGRRVHVPRLAAPGALDRRPGRHQRGEELPRRRRQHPPPVLRHHQGRRLPRPRGQRVPPRPGQRRHHRPDGRAGRAVRPRVRRPARQPLLRWRAGEPHVLRPWPDRPAVAARRLSAAGPPDRSRRRAPVQPQRAGRHGGHRRPLRRHRHPRPADRRGPVARRRRRRAGHRRLRQRVLPLDQRDELQRHRGVACAPRAPTSPTRATRRSTRRASRRPTTRSRSSR